MKKLLLILSFVLFSFGASAKTKSGTVEDYYQFCKPYQTNGFSPEGLKELQLAKALICDHSLTNLMKRGELNCMILNIFREKDIIDDFQFSRLSSFMANEFVRSKPLITSFLNYAENNPNKWSDHLTESTIDFLSAKFPCKIKN